MGFDSLELLRDAGFEEGDAIEVRRKTIVDRTQNNASTTSSSFVAMTNPRQQGLLIDWSTFPDTSRARVKLVGEFSTQSTTVIVARADTGSAPIVQETFPDTEFAAQSDPDYAHTGTHRFGDRSGLQLFIGAFKSDDETNSAFVRQCDIVFEVVL